LARKIVYNADLLLIVKDLDQAEQELKQLLKDHDAFVASAESGSTAGAPRRAFWRVRVPAERFESFLGAAARLGVPQKNRTDSQDVTEEYYDLGLRIKNKKELLDKFRSYLQDKRATSKVEEILTLEKEMERVSTELDQLEGRLRRLRDLTALATVTVTMQEIKDYVPPQAPTFANSLGATFADSINLLTQFGKGLLIAAVALAPWLVVLIPVAVPAWLVARRRWRGRPPVGQPAAALPAGGTPPSGA
jgi:hypothetical protein